MKCVICRSGEIVPGTATVTLERGATTVLIKAVPASVCAVCGEEYVDTPTTQQVMALAESAARSGVELQVIHFAAA